jgi:hypothetical protein
MMADLDQFSRFQASQPIIYDGVDTFGTWTQPSFLRERPQEDQIGVFRVTSPLEGRPDLIANQLYGTPLLDWVLISFNNARRSLNWPRSGDTIEYPLETVVLPELLG